jgi:acetate---CoA ligase (ADP-forming)
MSGSLARMSTSAAGPADAADLTGRPTRLREVDLDTFFRPRSVAVIGASDSPQRPATNMWRKLRAWADAFGATVTPVNPKRTELDGLVCVPTIHDVPGGPVDLAVILVGDSVTAFEEVAAAKAKFAVIFGAGFAEVGGDGIERQRVLAEMVGASDTHLLGPNTNLNAFETFDDTNPGPRLALITQSGHQGRPVFQSQDLGFAMSHWAPCGNEVDLEFADFAAWFADQPTTGAIAAYVEGFKDGRTVQLAADEAMQRGVPIVAVKVGKTDDGRSMAASHTGHLTGADRVIDGVFRQYGITRVEGLDELTELAAAFCRTVAPKPGRAAERRVCVYSISGGTGAHMADLCADAGLRIVPLSTKTQTVLRSMIPDYLRVSNPVDSGGAPSGDERGRKILDAIVADPEIDAVIVPITGALASMSDRFTQDLVDVQRTTTKPVFVVWGSPLFEESYSEVLAPNGIPVFRTFRNCVRAATAWFDYWDVQQRWASPFTRPVTRRAPAATMVAAILANAPGRGPLSEFDSKAVLAAYGIPVTRDVRCASATAAARAQREIGAPVVMKIDSADIAHKSDLGLVRIGVDGPASVRLCWDDFMTTVGRKAKGAHVDGVLVCETAPRGVETMVGVKRDELFGAAVAFGLGGVLLEVLDDVAVRVPPFDRDEARRMVDDTKVSQVLAGARGAKPAKVSAVVDVIMRMQRLAVDFADEIAEIDVNPLVATPSGVVALDALVVRG